MKRPLGWVDTDLGSCVDLLAGFAFKSDGFSSDQSDIPLVKGENVQQGYVDWKKAKRWPRAEYRQYAKFVLQPGDVVLAMDRPWVDAGLKWAFVGPRDPASLLVQRVARLRAKVDVVPGFIRAIVGSIAFADYVRPIVTGVNVPHISADQIRAFRLRLPPPLIQRKIAAILSAYDDLIENNIRRIAILEEMAKALYHEWFIEFRFPGHEKLRMEKSETGRMPSGWRVARLKELADTNASSIRRGAGPQRVAYVDITSVSTGAIEAIQRMPFSEAPSRARRLVQDGDTIWSCVRPNRRSFSLVLDPDPELVVSTGFAVLTPKAVPFAYLYLAVTTEEFTAYLTNHAQGAAYPAVTSKDFENSVVVKPAPAIANRFQEMVEPLLRLQETLRRRNSTLRMTRDLLLPRLISGDLDVSDLDIAVQEDVA